MGAQAYVSVEKANEYLVLDGSLSLLGQLLDTFRGTDVRERDVKREEAQPRHEREERLREEVRRE